MTKPNCVELCNAAIAGDLEAVDRMLNQEASLVNCRGEVREDHRAFMAGEGAADGWTPLHLASYYGQPAVVRRLIEAGADFNSIAENPLANTPVHTAVVAGQAECVTALLAHGPDLNLKDATGMTALDLAKENGASEIVTLIEGA